MRHCSRPSTELGCFPTACHGLWNPTLKRPFLAFKACYGEAQLQLSQRRATERGREPDGSYLYLRRTDAGRRGENTGVPVYPSAGGGMYLEDLSCLSVGPKCLCTPIS